MRGTSWHAAKRSRPIVRPWTLRLKEVQPNHMSFGSALGRCEDAWQAATGSLLVLNPSNQSQRASKASPPVP